MSKKKDIRPLGSRVLISPEVAKDKTDSGIFIPDQAKEKSRRGTVVAVGKEVVEVEVGDLVMYGATGGTEMKVKNESYLLMNEEYVMAVLS